MADELDLSRLAELGRLLDSGVPEIVATLLEELRRSLSAAEAALADGDLASAALAAHAARNSALMIGAQPLLDVLEALESSARADDREGALRAQRRVQDTWPQLCSALERAAAAQT